MTTAERAEQFEQLYAAYIAKLRRLDELQAKGRYGYQLRMPCKTLLARLHCDSKAEAKRFRAGVRIGARRAFPSR